MKEVFKKSSNAQLHFMFYIDVWDAHLYISKYNLQNFIILLCQINLI